MIQVQHAASQEDFLPPLTQPSCTASLQLASASALNRGHSAAGSTIPECHEANCCCLRGKCLSKKLNSTHVEHLGSEMAQSPGPRPVWRWSKKEIWGGMGTYRKVRESVGLLTGSRKGLVDVLLSLETSRRLPRKPTNLVFLLL